MFHCKNTSPECSSPRGDRYSKVCQHYGKCTPVRWPRFAHVKRSSFTHGHKTAHTGDGRTQMFEFKLKQQPVSCFISMFLRKKKMKVKQSTLGKSSRLFFF